MAIGHEVPDAVESLADPLKIDWADLSRQQRRLLFPDNDSWLNFEAFAGERAEQFRWKKITTGHRVGTFCWPAFWWPAIWFLYRRMYVIGAAIMLLPFCIALLLPTVRMSGSLGLSLSVFFGLFGQRLYIAHAKSIIADVRAHEGDTEDVRDKIAAAGGVSISAALIGVGLGLIGIASIAGKAFFQSRLPMPHVG